MDVQAQIYKEDQMPFPKLLAKLQRESETSAHHQRRNWPPVSERLFGSMGGFKVVDGYICICTLKKVRGQSVEEVQERLYPIAEFWTRVASGTHRTSDSNTAD